MPTPLHELPKRLRATAEKYGTRGGSSATKQKPCGKKTAKATASEKKSSVCKPCVEGRINRARSGLEKAIADLQEAEGLARDSGWTEVHDAISHHIADLQRRLSGFDLVGTAKLAMLAALKDGAKQADSSTTQSNDPSSAPQT